MKPVPPRFAAGRGGFTLIELLMAIGIIIVLVGIGVALGPALAGRGADQLTRSALSTAESVQTEYRALTGRWPIIVPDSIGENDEYPHTRIGAPAGRSVLAIGNEEDFLDHAIERFIASTMQVTFNDVVHLRRRSSLNSYYENIDSQLLRDDDDNDFFELYDGWGTRIAYVPPLNRVPSAWLGPTTDVFPLRSTPYFVSAGPSGDFDFAEDNIYSFDLVD